MSDKSSTSSGGIGFFGLLTIVFITLKLCNVIDWSWWWVLSPVWGGLALALTIIGIIVLFTTINNLIHKAKTNRKIRKRRQELDMNEETTNGIEKLSHWRINN